MRDESIALVASPSILLPIKEGGILGEKRGSRKMPKSRWDAKTKAMIVLEGLKGKAVSDICAEYQISQAHYYRWRDKFLANMPKVFADKLPQEVALKRQIADLKKVIGELTIELKKSEMDY